MNGCVIILKTKIVNIRWNPKNKKWYESKGYTYTKMGDEFEVKVEDLTERSHVRIEVQCDNEECKTPILKPIIWSNYKIDTKEDGKYYCHPCSMILYGTEKTIFAKLETGKKIEGLVKVNKVGSKMKIIEYINHENIIVSFENGGIVNCSYGNFKKGAVKNPMDLLVSGVGYIGCGEYGGKKDNVSRYRTWSNMLNRCYNEKIMKNILHMPIVQFVKSGIISKHFLDGMMIIIMR